MFGMGGTGPKPETGKKARTARKPARVPVTVRLEPRQREKFELLGGEAWLRDQIEQARFESVFRS